MEENIEQILSQSKEERLLNSTIECFYQDKKQLDRYKKSTEKYNKEIKKLMNNLNKTEFETDNGLVAKITISNKEDFVENMLINKLKELKVDGIIKTKEYVDMDALEDALYNNELDATELTNCIERKQVITLKVKPKKN